MITRHLIRGMYVLISGSLLVLVSGCFTVTDDGQGRIRAEARVRRLSIDPTNIALTADETAAPKIVKTVQLKNVGNEPLEINQVRTTCPCTGVQLERRQLGPGESAEMTVTVDTDPDRGVLP